MDPLTTLTALTGITKMLGLFVDAKWDDGGQVIGNAIYDLLEATGLGRSMGSREAPNMKNRAAYPAIFDAYWAMHTKWREFQHAAPWNKASTANAYYADCKKVGDMIASAFKAMQVSPITPVPPSVTPPVEPLIPGVGDKKKVPTYLWVAIGIGGALAATAIVATILKKK